MSCLVGGASSQSRGRRPFPSEWGEVVMLSRGPCSEVWRSSRGIHQMKVTWVGDQGFGVLGYTCESNPLTQGHMLAWNSTSFGPGGIVSQEERDAARLLVETVGRYAVGGGDRVRFLANGSDAVECAVKLARAYTGRNLVVSVGYHGSGQTFAHPPQGSGVPEEVVSLTAHLPWLSLPPPDWPLGDPACVIIEVPSTDDYAAEYLSRARTYCDERGSLLLLDEVVTGFRLALGGAAELYNVQADLLCYGKAMSNGRPISAVVGRAEIMGRLDEDVFMSNTLNGDPHSCAQVAATLRRLTADPETYPKLWGVGEALRMAMAEVGVRLTGHAPRTFLDFSTGDKDVARTHERRREFCRGMIKRGVIMDQPNYASLAHKVADIKRTAQAAELAIRDMRLAGIIGGHQ